MKVSLTDSDKDLDTSSAYLSLIKLACMENGDPPSSLAGSPSDLTSESPTVASISGLSLFHVERQ